MLHLRLVVPADLSDQVLEALSRNASVTNLVRWPGVAIKPAGDLLGCDVAREDGSVVLEQLKAMGVDRSGSIAVEMLDASLSDAADAATLAAEGSPGNAVVWEEVESQTSESSELNASFLMFLVLATVIAGIGILTDSVVLIIGAMVVGPEFGPLAGLCVATVQRRWSLALRSSIALLVGFPVAIAATWLSVVALRACNVTPATLARTQTLFISHPDAYSVIVALLAGVAGILSLSTAKSGALIGVLISVTTVPAAANMAVAAAYLDFAELRGAALQLLVNLACAVGAGITTLGAQCWVWSMWVKR
ncbi:MAG: DUF389 domain-containing protein [Myxococcales bacterium]|nr:DUF389 domain-containing protein [Myxococcales bacterium]